MWLSRPLDDVLSSPAKLAALRVLHETSEPVSGREIARRAGIAPGHVSRVLRQLEASGLLGSQTHGQVKLYSRVASTCPLAEALAALFAAEGRRRQAVIDGLPTDTPGLLSVIQCGAEVVGHAGPGSTVHLLVVVRRHTPEVEAQVCQQCEELSRRYLVDLCPQVATAAELAVLEAALDPFWLHVVGHGVALYGKTPAELSRWRTWADDGYEVGDEA